MTHILVTKFLMCYGRDSFSYTANVEALLSGVSAVCLLLLACYLHQNYCTNIVYWVILASKYYYHFYKKHDENNAIDNSLL